MATLDIPRNGEISPTAGQPGAHTGSMLDPGALWLACSRSPAYFVDRCVQLYDPTGPGGGISGGWQPFRLWPAQVRAIETLEANRLCVILKARQLGMSWLTVGFALWHMIFRPAATVLLFSKRDDEAVHLLSFRLRGMYDRLPPPLQASAIARDNAHEFRLSNGSAALAFPTTGGRSYTASIAIVDEADHVSGGAGSDDLDQLLNAVKPTIDAGGRLILLSTVDKSRPESAFKRIYRAAARGENAYTPIFLSWRARPGRTDEWYEEQVRDVRMRTGGLDDLRQEYPATVADALAPRAADKFFRADQLEACCRPLVWAGPPEDEHGDPDVASPDLPGLVIHVPPAEGAPYVIGVHPAEGNPQASESAAVVFVVETREQVATLTGRADPVEFAGRVNALALLYNQAPVLVERNDHGHMMLCWLRETGELWVLRDRDKEYGWPATGPYWHMAFDQVAAVLREGGLLLRDEETLRQMMSLDGDTLKAPPGQNDGRAVACVVGLAAIKWCSVSVSSKPGMIPPRPLWEEDEELRW